MVPRPPSRADIGARQRNGVWRRQRCDRAAATVGVAAGLLHDHHASAGAERDDHPPISGHEDGHHDHPEPDAPPNTEAVPPPSAPAPVAPPAPTPDPSHSAEGDHPHRE